MSVLGMTNLEVTDIGIYHDDSGVSLGGTSAHVLDIISLTFGVNFGEDMLVRLDLLESYINSDTTLMLSQSERSLSDRSLTSSGDLLLDLLNGSLIEITALIDQVSGGGRFARV